MNRLLRLCWLTVLSSVIAAASSSAQLVADFTMTVNGSPTDAGCAPVTLAVTDASAGSPTTWFWNFGSAGTSPLQGPLTKTLTNPGDYNISLTVSDGTTTDTKTRTVHVYGHPKPSFSASPLAGCVGTMNNVQFS